MNETSEDEWYKRMATFPLIGITEDEWYKRMAIKKAKKQKVQILPATTFPLIGICGKCAEEVRAIPNWGCRNPVCPHRP